MSKIKNISFTTVYTLLFTALFFVGKEIFFPSSYLLEEKYTEPNIGADYTEIDERGYYSFTGVTQEENEPTHAMIYESFHQKYTEKQKDKVSFRYIPSQLEEDIKNSYIPLAEMFFYKRDILSKVEKLRILLYQNKGNTRGRMKSKDIHLFGIMQMSDEEFLGVMIHEFGHYLDIYSLARSTFGDESNKFYDISWESVSIIKKGLTSQDFVSGYAMTNRYEDFAESYVYYILHNRDFFQKAQENTNLARKYDFFQKYIFSQKQFYKQDFSSGEELKDYYWDITKLSVDIKKFLQYLQSSL